MILFSRSRASNFLGLDFNVATPREPTGGLVKHHAKIGQRQTLPGARRERKPMLAA